MSFGVVIVTGGAGYLGSCAAQGLKDSGYEPIIIDNLSTGNQLPKGIPFVNVDLTDLPSLRAALSGLPRIEAVIHFAARAVVNESIRQPEEYLRNNVLAALNIGQVSVELGIRSVVHSSSCAVYGFPDRIPIDENVRIKAVTPYGESKAIAETIFQQLKQYRKLNVTSLRYFNPGGSYRGGMLGECHSPETHLIPLVVDAAMNERSIKIFGSDFPTPDGTGVRDYIHVEDLIDAHIACLRFLNSNPENQTVALNIGAGHGSSVLEVIATTEEVLGKKVHAERCPKRPGDPPVLVADIAEANKILGWHPKRSLKDILESQYQWAMSRR